MDERRQRNIRLTPDQRWQIFLEASRQEHHRRRGVPQMGNHHLAAQGDPGQGQGRIFGGSAPGTGPQEGDQQVVQLQQELERSNEALKELAFENTLLRGKVNGV